MKVKSFIFKTVVLVLKKVICHVFLKKDLQVFNGRNDKKASGLGLYLCKNIFNQLDHLISIESKVGQGTTVCLDFSKKEIFIE